MEKTKLNLGCGKDIKEGYVNVDSVKLSGVDVIQELSDYPWKFKDNEFDEVYARFILEHLPDNIKVMEEIWRISKPGAIIKIWVPHFSSDYCWGDIQHMRGYTLISFDIFLESCPYNFYNKCHFKINKKQYNGRRLYRFLKILNLHNIALRYLNNIGGILYFELEVVK